MCSRRGVSSWRIMVSVPFLDDSFLPAVVVFKGRYEGMLLRFLFPTPRANNIDNCELLIRATKDQIVHQQSGTEKR
jgi:hypothetical protein